MPPETWTFVRLGEVLERVRRPIAIEAESEYHQVGLRSFGKGFFFKEPVTGESLGNKKIFEIREGDLVFNIVFAWEGAVGLASAKEDGWCGSHRFPTYRVRREIADAHFIKLLFQTAPGVQLLGDASPGSAGRNRTLNQGQLLEQRIALPSLEAQRRVVDLISAAEFAATRAGAVVSAGRAARDALREEMLGRVGGQSTVLGDVCQSVRTKTDDPASSGFERYVGLEHLTSGDATISAWGHPGDVSSTKTCFEAGDVLFGKLRPYLRKVAIAPWEGICSTDILAFRGKSDEITPKYLELVLASDAAIQYAVATSGGTKMPRTSVSALAMFDFVLPPIAEQERIAAVMADADNVVTTAERRSRAAEEALLRLREAVVSGDPELPPSYDRVLRDTDAQDALDTLAAA